MAKPNIPSQKSMYGALNQRLNKYLLLVQQIFDDLNLEAAKAATSVSYDTDAGKPFRFADYPTLTQKVKDLQQRYVDDIGTVIYSGTSAEWKKSNEAQNLLADGVLKAYGAQVNGDRYKIYYQPNNDAMKAFQRRRANGMTLSQKLWNQASNYKQEMEYAISSAIEKGTSAVTLSKRLSKYLHDFPSLQKDYKEKFGKAVDCHDCEYRSMRLARSEINMAYRSAEQERWNQMDFVVGYEIKLSGSHPAEDICDMLKGKYPKDFVWTGWHPNDLCYKIPILKAEEEFWNYGDERNKPSTKEVKDVPPVFNDWVVRNRMRIKAAEKAGTLPFFLSDNKGYYKKYISKKDAIEWRHSRRDDEAIKTAWANRAFMKQDGTYAYYLNINKKANVFGLDVSHMDSSLRSNLLDEASKQVFLDMADDAMDYVNEAYGQYEKIKSKLLSVKEELASPLGFRELNYWRVKVNNYYDKLPTSLDALSYGEKIYLPEIHKLVSDAKRKIDFKIVQNQSQNIKDVEKRLGTKILKPMNHKNADSKNPNVNHTKGVKDAYGVNCQCCVVAYELRRRGFDVTAMPNFNDGKFPDILARDATKIWKTDYKRRPKQIDIVFESDKQWTPSDVKAHVESHIKEDGRYHFTTYWNKNEGHIVCVEKKGDNIFWYDPQSDKVLTEAFFAPSDLNIKMHLLRVDNLLIYDKEIENVVRKIRSEFRKRKF